MPARAANRIERSKGELERLHNELSAWLDRRRKRDVRGQYRTQVDTLETVLRTGLEGVSQALGGVGNGTGVGEAYAACTAADQGMLWVRRVWSYFAEKFDQRDHPASEPILAAADEIVWSCWAEPFEQAGPAARGAAGTPPAPLPYLESLYSPQAFVRRRPPPGLRRPPGVSQTLQRAMDDFLRELPIPVIALPIAAVQVPLWLALLPHEIGHHVQSELLPGAKAVGDFGVWLRDRNGAEGSRWQGWGEEIFADTVSALALGPAAVWVAAETLLAADDEMYRSDSQYPPPVVRLAYLVALCNELGAPADAAAIEELAEWTGDCDGSDGPERAAARAWSAASAVLAKEVVDWAPSGLKPVPRLTGWDPTRFNPAVHHWRGMVRGDTAPNPEETRDAARTIAAATVLECAEALRDPGAADRVTEIAARALPLLAQSREPGTRAVGEAPAVDRIADAFAALLRRPDVTQELGTTDHE